MAIFKGTISEFIRLFGNNLLSNEASSYSKIYRKNIAKKCEWDKVKKIYGIKKNGELDDCRNHSQIQSAHRHEKNKIYLAIQILEKYKKTTEKEEIISVDIDKFLAEFREAHQPISETFFILCSHHHSMYDNPERYDIKEIIPIKNKIDDVINPYKEKTKVQSQSYKCADNNEYFIDNISSKKNKFKFTHALIKKLVDDNPGWDFNKLFEVVGHIHSGTKNKIIKKKEEIDKSTPEGTYNMDDNYIIKLGQEEIVVYYSISSDMFKKVLWLYFDRPEFVNSKKI